MEGSRRKAGHEIVKRDACHLTRQEAGRPVCHLSAPRPRSFPFSITDNSSHLIPPLGTNGQEEEEAVQTMVLVSVGGSMWSPLGSERRMLFAHRYCNREFDDEKILIQHQKAKHFKCHICHKKLYTGPGLAIHCMQVHKETIDRIPNALPNRNSVDIEIYGMEGIPENDIREHEKSRGSDYIPPSTSSFPVKPLLPVTAPLLAAGLVPPLSLPTAGPSLPVAPFPGMQSFPPPPAGIPLPNHHNFPPLPAGIPPPPLPPPGQPPVIAFQMNLPRKPLFPAAASALLQQPPPVIQMPPSAPPPLPAAPEPVASAVSTGPASTGPAPAVEERPAVQLVPPASGSSRIVHPDEDLSLEELRARLPRYQNIFQATHRSSSAIY